MGKEKPTEIWCFKDNNSCKNATTAVPFKIIVVSLHIKKVVVKTAEIQSVQDSAQVLDKSGIGPTVWCSFSQIQWKQHAVHQDYSEGTF